MEKNSYNALLMFLNISKLEDSIQIISYVFIVYLENYHVNNFLSQKLPKPSTFQYIQRAQFKASFVFVFFGLVFQSNFQWTLIKPCLQIWLFHFWGFFFALLECPWWPMGIFFLGVTIPIDYTLPGLDTVHLKTSSMPFWRVEGKTIFSLKIQ